MVVTNSKFQSISLRRRFEEEGQTNPGGRGGGDIRNISPFFSILCCSSEHRIHQQGVLGSSLGLRSSIFVFHFLIFKFRLFFLFQITKRIYQSHQRKELLIEENELTCPTRPTCRNDRNLNIHRQIDAERWLIIIFLFRHIRKEERETRPELTNNRR